MVHFLVFLNAPSAADIDADPNDYFWQTVQEPSSTTPYPPATLDAASRRISLLYQNVIFDSILEQELEPDHVLASQQDDDDAEHPDGTTFVTWPPTPAANTTGAPSFLRPSCSFPRGTYETQDTSSSVEYSDASSITRFPNFQFSLHKVTPLSSLCIAAKSGSGSRKVNMLLAALEVQGPDTVRVKKGPDAGREISILKLVLGDEQGSVCKLTAWRDTADAWGGVGPSPGLKRGDILYFESTFLFHAFSLQITCSHTRLIDLMATWEAGNTVTLTASPYIRPSTQICYRTMPYAHEDSWLRPDLRLGQSDVAVNKVAALVRWFENMAGLPGA
ncbi:hypothetical protein J3R82DRAFT_5020 [Butyriboletus roseoflavus]|nr:hypothetical protein J3R82DRAFT_5020 [Butyriboletus roseoflavus]